MTLFSARGNAYDDQGDGHVAFLFLPGWCGPRTYFRPLIDRLSDEHRTLSIDWRGHGESPAVHDDFGTTDLVNDAAGLIEETGAHTVIPVAAAHAGWVAIELRRRLGADRVPALAFLDWMVLGAPAPFRGALAAMADLATTRSVVDQVTGMWLAGLDVPDLTDYVVSMAAQADEMWARGAGEIAAQFDRHPIPVEAVAAIEPPPATLHLYAQPADPAFYDAQRAFAAAHDWFEVVRLDAVSHFPIFEVPDAIAEHLRKLAATAT